jgi:Peptidase family M23/Putative peptidoglycan binding domain
MSQPVIHNKKIAEKYLNGEPDHYDVESNIGTFRMTGGFMEKHKAHSQKSNINFLDSNNSNQIQHYPNQTRCNLGIDYVVADKKVNAWYGGEVSKVGEERGYGNRVHVKTDVKFEYQGKLYPVYSAYAHLENSNVKIGQKIEQGEYIATMGGTGGNYPEHVDLRTWIEVDGKKIDVSPNLINDQLARRTIEIPTPEQAKKNPTLEQGNDGSGVTYLKAQLASLGYLNKEQINNNFDADTKAAVEAFEVNKGIPKDGKVDAKVWEALAIELREQQHQLESPEFRGQVVAQNARNIVHQFGKEENGNKVYRGSTYTITQSGDRLNVSALERGEILRAQGDKITFNQTNQNDLTTLSRVVYQRNFGQNILNNDLRAAIAANTALNILNNDPRSVKISDNHKSLDGDRYHKIKQEGDSLTIYHGDNPNKPENQLLGIKNGEILLNRLDVEGLNSLVNNAPIHLRENSQPGKEKNLVKPTTPSLQKMLENFQLETKAPQLQSSVPSFSPSNIDVKRLQDKMIDTTKLIAETNKIMESFTNNLTAIAEILPKENSQSLENEIPIEKYNSASSKTKQLELG